VGRGDRNILLENREVGGRDPRQSRENREPRRCRSRNAARRSGLSQRKLFPRGKEEKFVLQNWTAHISTPAVEVKAGVSVIAGATVADNSRVLLQGVEGVQFSILQELVYPAVKIVSAALGHGNKLAARRMAVLGRELILQQREFRHRFGGDID